MPIYTFICKNCGEEFDSIEKFDTKFTYCKSCGMIGIREKIELCAPAKLVAGCGGFSSPAFGERKYS